MNKILVTLLFLQFLSLGLSGQYATDIQVAKDGSGDYVSIQKAIDDTKSFPDKAITITIKNGVYNEKVRIYPWNTNLTIVGESADSTIITYEDFFSKLDEGRNSTFHTYTFSVEADDVTVRNLTIKNSSGPVGQAIALSVQGNRCKFENCKILGHQDTLYCTGENNYQYFLQCYIEGTTDFIFGNAIAVFEECRIHSLSDSYITAASTVEGQAYGFVFLDCHLTAKKEVKKVYLGRPWRPFARTVFINCLYEPHILPEGWSKWGKDDDIQAYYAEYNPTYDLSKRVSWSTKLTSMDLIKYDPKIIFDNWNYKQ